MSALSKSDARTLKHAAVLLDQEAKSLYDSYQVDGDLNDIRIKREHDDFTRTAARLREIAGAKS